MGPCCSSRAGQLRKQFNTVDVINHFLAELQLEYMSKLRPNVEAHLKDQVRKIEKDKMDDIARRQKMMESHYQAVLIKLRLEPQKINRAETRRNMKVEEIIGLQGKRSKFSELKKIVRQRIKNVQIDMMMNVDQRFEAIQKKLKENMRAGTILGRLQIQQLQQLQRDFKYGKHEQVQKCEKQIEQQVNKKINFDFYTKHFIGVIPQQQLLSLSEVPLISYLLVYFRLDPESQNYNCCWCAV